MPFELQLRCRCGQVQGVAHDVSPAGGFRVTCYCKDCQAFARFLDQPDVLDAAGGTDIVQMPPGRVTLTAGADALACLRLSDNTPVLRWYAACCNTPVANTAGARFPLIGLIHSVIDRGAAGRRSLDEIFGPPLCRIHERSATAPLPADAPPRPSLALFANRASKLLAWWWRGLARPNPFFDERTGAPHAKPRLLTAGEREGLFASER